jgi:hypothetical protein
LQSSNKPCVPQANPFQGCLAGHALLAIVQAPLLPRNCPRGQTAHGPFKQSERTLSSAVSTGFVFRKGWKNDRELCFSGAALSLLDDDVDLLGEDVDLENDDECDAVLVPP